MTSEGYWGPQDFYQYDCPFHPSVISVPENTPIPTKAKIAYTSSKWLRIWLYFSVASSPQGHVIWACWKECHRIIGFIKDSDFLPLSLPWSKRSSVLSSAFLLILHSYRKVFSDLIIGDQKTNHQLEEEVSFVVSNMELFVGSPCPIQMLSWYWVQWLCWVAARTQDTLIYCRIFHLQEKCYFMDSR